MQATTDELQLLKGWIIPFFPMRPTNGPAFTKKLVAEILDKQEEGNFVYQPKLNGDRAILAVHEKQVIIFNRYHGYYPFQVANSANFLKLGDGTLFDGEVWERNFYPFDLLALEGRSYKPNTTAEREIMAMQMCKLCGVPWMFPKPTKKWLMAGRAHAPKYEGVVRKRADLGYVILPNSSGTSLGWLKHRW